MDYQVNDIVLVNAWWDKPKVIKCQIKYIWQSNTGSLDKLLGIPVKNHADVQPLEGNPHLRSVKFEEIVNIVQRGLPTQEVDFPKENYDKS